MPNSVAIMPIQGINIFRIFMGVLLKIVHLVVSQCLTKCNGRRI